MTGINTSYELYTRMTNNNNRMSGCKDIGIRILGYGRVVRLRDIGLREYLLHSLARLSVVTQLIRCSDIGLADFQLLYKYIWFYFHLPNIIIQKIKHLTKKTMPLIIVYFGSEISELKIKDYNKNIIVNLKNLLT